MRRPVVFRRFRKPDAFPKGNDSMSDIHASRRLRAVCVTLVVVVGALALSLAAGGSNATLHTTIDTWSRTIGADAHAVSLAAKGRHPRRMISSALHFRSDALRARTTIAAQHPSTAKGAEARRLVLSAFTDYALAGSRWAATGRARLNNRRALASSNARAAARYARAGNRLLLAASTLLR